MCVVIEATRSLVQLITTDHSTHFHSSPTQSIEVPMGSDRKQKLCCSQCSFASLLSLCSLSSPHSLAASLQILISLSSLSLPRRCMILPYRTCERQLATHTNPPPVSARQILTSRSVWRALDLPWSLGLSA